MGRWRWLHVVLGAIGLLGVFALVDGVIALIGRSGAELRPLYVLAASFAVAAPWSVRLPSGALWRPAMGLLTAGILLLSPGIAPLAAVPGLVLITALSRKDWWDYPLTTGHVSAGLYAGAAVYQHLAPNGPAHLGDILPAAIAGLTAHFVVNRALSAAIVAVRQRRSLLDQLRLSARELHWGYLGLYLVSLAAAALYRDEGLVGLLLAAALMVTLSQSITYYTRMHSWQQAAQTDGLTGVANRNAWEAFERAMHERPRPGTVAMIDLDGFKAVNDRHGHLVGDAVLQDIAAALRRTYGRADQCFRYGGDEFVLFVPHGPGAEAAVQQQIHECLDVVATQWRRQGHPVRASVGIATLPADGSHLAEVLRVADARMYRMKAAERDAVQAAQ